MITNHQPYVAVVRQGDTVRLLPVAAWREDGTPMVCDGHYLVSVKTVPGFQHVMVRVLGRTTPTSWKDGDQFQGAIPAEYQEFIKGRDPRQVIRTNLAEESK